MYKRQEQQDRLGKISAAAHHLLSILNDILDLSKIEAGKLMLEQTEFDLDGVLGHVCTLVADKAQAKNIELVMEIAPALANARMLRGDPTRLTQLLLNYLGNAVKFTERGEIAVAIAPAIHRGEIAPYGVRIQVSDTGPGIAATELNHLFEEYSQGSAPSGSALGIGVGIGPVSYTHLDVYKRQAEEHLKTPSYETSLPK